MVPRYPHRTVAGVRVLSVVVAFVAVVLRCLKHCGIGFEVSVAIVVRWPSVGYCGNF